MSSLAEPAQRSPEATALPRFSALAVVAAGAAALSAAMGAGRFAFTPLLPGMIEGGWVDVAGGARLATANYIGYLLGALLTMVLPRRFHNTRTIRAGLVATVVLTAAMAVPLPAEVAMPAWQALRLAAGVASAFAFVFTASWVAEETSRRGVPALGSATLMGPGFGIAATGVLVALAFAAGIGASGGWLVCGVFAAVLTASVWPVLRAGAGTVLSGGAGGSGAALPGRPSPEVLLLSVAYGFAGFGYIVTATFLPVIAGHALPGSPWLGAFWPFYGIASALGAFLAARQRKARDPRLLLLLGCLCQAVGVTLPLWLPTSLGFMAGSFLAGLPFTALTFFIVQEMRRLRPLDAPRFVGFATALYGIGQIAGPPLARTLLTWAGDEQAGLLQALLIAGSGLILAAALFGFAVWRWRK